MRSIFLATTLAKIIYQCFFGAFADNFASIELVTPMIILTSMPPNSPEVLVCGRSAIVLKSDSTPRDADVVPPTPAWRMRPRIAPPQTPAVGKWCSHYGGEDLIHIGEPLHGIGQRLFVDLGVLRPDAVADGATAGG
jgi:hypothetical protein